VIASPQRNLANGDLAFWLGITLAVVGSYAIWLAIASPAGEFLLAGRSRAS